MDGPRLGDEEKTFASDFVLGGISQRRNPLRMSLKEKILQESAKRMETDVLPDIGTKSLDLCSGESWDCDSNIRDRIRINNEQLKELLSKNPLRESTESEQNGNNVKAQQDSDSDLPFHSGPLRLSVYRESPPTPSKTYDVSLKYDAVFESFVKPRPLSESFALAAFDITTSSSDEDLSDPVPESPLNLSDTDDMASSFGSPSIFHRRKQKPPTNNLDARPSSLYDNAKPRPPTKEKIDRPNSVGEKLSRLINRRPWKSNDAKRQEDSSYHRSFEPVPPDRWSNVVENNDAARLQPHPPITSPANPVPVRRKKRLAPKPPTNVPPGSNKDNMTPAPSNGEIQESIEEGNACLTNASSASSVRSQSSTSIPSDNALDTPSTSTPPVPPQRNVKKAKLKSSTAGPTNTPNIESQDGTITHHSDPEMAASTNSTKTQERYQLPKSNAQGLVVSVDATKLVASEHATPHYDALPDSSKQLVSGAGQSTSQIERTTIGPTIPGSNISMKDPGTPSFTGSAEKHTPDLSSQEKPLDSSTESETTLQNDVRFILDSVLDYIDRQLDGERSGIPEKSGAVQIGKETGSNNESFELDNSDSLKSVINDITLTNDLDSTLRGTDDVTSCGIRANKEKGDRKTPRNRKSMDNASSGYSSPGSGDEGPTSPETPLSPLTLPSPTSSYYSTSLSASSSRVSNLSRELTLPKQAAGVPDKVVTKPDQSEQDVLRPLPEDPSPDTQAIDQHHKSNEAINKANIDISSHNSSEIPTEVSKQDSKPVKSATVPRNTKLDSTQPAFEALPDMPVKLRKKPSATRIRPKSEYIQYSSETEFNEHSKVSICMIEKPGDSTSLSRAQARLFKPQHYIKGSKKKTLAAQKSRAFAMRARPHWQQRHSYAEPSSYILDETEVFEPTSPGSNLSSHFVSTQNISTYFDGKEQKSISPQEILTSKRDEFFNAFKNTTLDRNREQFGGSVRQLPVSAKEFGFIHCIQEVAEVDSAVRTEEPVVAKAAENQESVPEASPQDDKENVFQRQPSETGSTSSSSHQHSNSSVFTGSSWSLSTDMTSQTNRTRKPSLRRRIRGAFSFQNIRKAISMEKLSEEEKQSRSMSHQYLSENDPQFNGGRQRSATLQEKSSNYNDFEQTSNLRKAPSISSIISSVRMRKRKSRNKADPANRYTIGDPETFAKNAQNAPEIKRSTLRPMSMILSNTNRRKLEDVGNPNFFRPIGRVLQMNPTEGTLLVELVKPPSGPFGFYIARKKDSGDTGSVFISRLSDSYPNKMFAGLMQTGDEITEVNGSDVSRLTLDQVYDLILDSEKTLLKIRPKSHAV